MAKEEFTAKEIAEARERIEAERESSLLTSRAERLASAAGLGGIGGSDSTGGFASADATSRGSSGPVKGGR